MTPAGLPAKLDLVLKALTLSRAQLAQALGVDKSLVGRWVSGKVTPSSHNLAVLTRFIAERRPGFTLMDWERAEPDFAARLGVEAPGAASSPGEDWVPESLLEQSRHGVRTRAGAYDGFWISTRPSHDLPGRFLRDVTLISSDAASGRVLFRTRVVDTLYEGWALLLQHQLFSVSTDEAGASIMFSIFNGVARDRPHVIDGLTLSTLRDAGGSPVAAPCIMERLEASTGDVQADQARLDALAAQTPVVADDAAIPEEHRAHLHAGVGDGPAGFLRLLAVRSIARGQRLFPETLDALS